MSIELDDISQIHFRTGARVLADASRSKEIDPSRCAYLASSLVELIANRRKMAPEEYRKLEEAAQLLRHLSAEATGDAEEEMPPPTYEEE
jgi:hypothetical protein